jgi:hypothetical protein
VADVTNVVIYHYVWVPKVLPARTEIRASIMISTRYGAGPMMWSTINNYIYRPLPMYTPKQFYRPKYSANTNANNVTDLRSTIHWEPNLVADSTGKATFSFYAANKPGKYTVIIQGTNMDGQFGYQTTSINIAPKPGEQKPILNR